jgi:hypothetical protein
MTTNLSRILNSTSNSARNQARMPLAANSPRYIGRRPPPRPAPLLVSHLTSRPNPFVVLLNPPRFAGKAIS